LIIYSSLGSINNFFLKSNILVMKRIFRFGFTAMLLLPIYGLAQSWSWETTFPNATINDMKTLPSGTTYLVGDFKQVTPKDSVSAADYFLLKVDSSGNIVGGFKKAPDNLGIGRLIGSDNKGNIYVLGTPFTPQTNNYYLHKYTPGGNSLWVRRFYVEGGIKAMDVNYDRVALTGHYKKIMLIYGFDKVKVDRDLGEDCDPEWQYPCQYNKFDAFITTFDQNGNLLWADNYYSEPVSAPDPENYYGYYTLKDFNDYGVDIAIDKDQNIIFQGLFSWEEPWPQYMIIGTLKLSFGNVDNWPLTIAKFDPNGQVLWASIEKDGMKYVDPNKRITTDKDGNIYQLQEYYPEFGGVNGVGILIYKRKPNGSIIWKRVVPTSKEEEFYIEGWTWHMDDLGNSYIYGQVDPVDISIILDKSGNIIQQFSDGKLFLSSKMGIDLDANLYFQRGNKLKKYIQNNPTSFTFTGTGIWSEQSNWEHETIPPIVLRKWDTVNINTLQNDSCVLDVPQTILPGALLIVNEGSRLIVPGDIQTDPHPTPISSVAEVSTSLLPKDNMFMVVMVTKGEFPESSGIQVTADLTIIGGPAAQPLNDAGIEGDLHASDFRFSMLYTLPDTTSPGQKVIPYKVWDAQSRMDSGNVTLTVLAVIGSPLIISQIYYAGGTTGAAYQNDYIELFNRGNTTVSLEGKSLQYASGNGSDLFSTQSPVLLSGDLLPGQYYLISLAAGANGAPLPLPADATGDINLLETGGKVILVNSTEGLPCNGSSTPCNTSQKSLMVDLVGYGNANFFETTVASALPLARASVLLRNWEGAQDTDNNRNDFYPATPTPRSKTSLKNEVKPRVVISQVHTNGGVKYRNDFVELYNAGNSAQNLNGWSLQYADSNAANWQVTPLSGTIQPGQYLLIMQAAGTSGSYLPPPDFIGNIDLSTTGGKLVLSSSNTIISGSCPSGDNVVDMVGYGLTDCHEGSAPVAGTIGLRRKGSGYVDTDNNLQDFFEGELFPRNKVFSVFHPKFRVNESILADTRDGQIYPVKRIGQKVWMLQNLNFNSSASKAYDNDPTNTPIYGRLYYPSIGIPNSTTVSGAPSGWKLPSSNDWKQLVAIMGNTGELKDTLYWNAPNTGGTNNIGFNIRPGGYFGGGTEQERVFAGKGSSALFATSDGRRLHMQAEYNLLALFNSTSDKIGFWNWDAKYWGEEYWVSVRCVKD
jgi:uncharacterized protein (TIGR02145 family)